MQERKYAFNWDLLGDREAGRPNLGPFTRIEAHRLMQFTLRDVIEKHYGDEVADKIFYEAGYIAGKAFYDHFLMDAGGVGDFIKKLQAIMKDMKIGVLRVEAISEGAMSIKFTIDESLECSGLPVDSGEVCVYNEGFISGILENYTGRRYLVKEVDCWRIEDRTCRFIADVSFAGS